jgi:DNA-binding response OmpR family regulator
VASSLLSGVVSATEPTPSVVGTKGRVLVVDDAIEFQTLVADLLRKEGYDVLVADDGRGALEHARSPLDLVVLDLTLPDLDGLEVCRRLREMSDAYVVMLTARDEEVDRVMGLKTGADDYITKPFSPRELVARIEARLRRPRVRTEGHDDAAIRVFGELRIDLTAREVTVGDQPVQLTRIEFDLLEALSRRPKVVLTRAVLLEQVWGENWFGDDHVIDVHIANLRKKIDLGVDRSRIRTVRGVGYRMDADA